MSSNRPAVESTITSLMARHLSESARAENSRFQYDNSEHDANFAEAKVRAADVKRQGILKDLKEIKSQIADPPTKDITTGGGKGGTSTKTVVDERELNKLKREESELVQKDTNALSMLEAAQQEAQAARAEASSASQNLQEASDAAQSTASEIENAEATASSNSPNTSTEENQTQDTDTTENTNNQTQSVEDSNTNNETLVQTDLV